MMKTLKFLMLFFSVIFFAVISAIAQPQKETWTLTTDFCGIVDCSGEHVCGTLVGHYSLWDSKFQRRVKGTAIGQETGDVYTFSELYNDNWKPWSEEGSFNQTQMMTFSVERNGVPIGIVHGNGHITRNANGVWLEFRDNVVIECY